MELKCYEIMEYNQKPNSDEIYNSNVEHPFFNDMDELKEYIRKNKIRGKVFEYNKEEHDRWHDDNYGDGEVEWPEPTNEWDTTLVVEDL